MKSIIPTEKKYIVNEDGEVLQELQPGDRILSGNSVKYLTNTVIMKNRFIKVNDLILYELSSKADFINKLLKYISYTDGVLRYSNGKYVLPSNLEKHLHISVRTIQRKFKELMDEDVIHKCKSYNGSFFYVFNPYIAMRGKRITKELYEEFKNSKWANFE